MAKIRLLPFLVALGAIVGCGTGSQLAEVEGVVTFKGKPIDRLEVQFLPDPEKKTKGPRSTGVTNAEGRFQLLCDDGQKGAVIGHHRVLIRDLKMFGDKIGRLSEAEAAKLPPSRIAMLYSDSLKSPIKMEIKQGQKSVELAVE